MGRGKLARYSTNVLTDAHPYTCTPEANGQTWGCLNHLHKHATTQYADQRVVGHTFLTKLSAEHIQCSSNECHPSAVLQGRIFPENLLSTYCVNPAGNKSACRHGHGGWHRACVVVPKHAGQHPRRAYRKVDSYTGAKRREESRPICQRGYRGQLRGFCRGRLVEIELGLEDLASVSVFALWRMVAAVLYTHTQPATANLGTRGGVLERTDLRRSGREIVRAWCSRTCRTRAAGRSASQGRVSGRGPNSGGRRPRCVRKS